LCDLSCSRSCFFYTCISLSSSCFLLRSLLATFLASLALAAPVRCADICSIHERCASDVRRIDLEKSTKGSAVAGLDRRTGRVGRVRSPEMPPCPPPPLRPFDSAVLRPLPHLRGEAGPPPLLSCPSAQHTAHMHRGGEAPPVAPPGLRLGLELRGSPARELTIPPPHWELLNRLKRGPCWSPWPKSSKGRYQFCKSQLQYSPR
jgi:hypothetical protein